MRSRFDEQLSLINKEMIEMGALCEEAISYAVEALFTDEEQEVLPGEESRAELLERVKQLEQDIDHKERSVESACLKVLLLQQPVARDLRQVSAALKMITDMERIGDQAEDIAEIIPYLKGNMETEEAEIRKMATEVRHMVKASVDAYVQADRELAHQVMKKDDVVDECFARMKTLLIDRISKAPEDGEYAMDLMMVCKYFERIGDHAVNVAEWVVFSITGEHEGV